jgi:hypothetical protein
VDFIAALKRRSSTSTDLAARLKPRPFKASQVAGLQSGLFCDAGEHYWANLVVIVNAHV